MGRTDRPRHGVLILVQNLPAERDRRVWSQATSLVAAGHEVSVVCPAGPSGAGHRVVRGVHLFAYPPAPEGIGAVGYAIETAWSLLASSVLLLLVLATRPVDVVQACNPPDVYWLLGAVLRGRRVPFVFDHHDLAVELFESRYHRTRGLAHGVLRWLERQTYRHADHVIVPNHSYRDVATGRHAVPLDRVTVVRNGPDTPLLGPGSSDPVLRRGRAHLCCYLGMMGPQDRVDLVLHAFAGLVHDLGRTDVHLALLGAGPCLAEVQALATDLDLEEHVTFTGFADDATIRRYLSTASLGVAPEPPTTYNHASTMIKVAEYMAFGLPVVAFDLTETRRTAEDAAIYADGEDPSALTAAMDHLLDRPDLRGRMGRAGRARVRRELAWSHQLRIYLELYDRLLRRSVSHHPVPAVQSRGVGG